MRIESRTLGERHCDAEQRAEKERSGKAGRLKQAGDESRRARVEDDATLRVEPRAKNGHERSPRHSKARAAAASV